MKRSIRGRFPRVFLAALPVAGMLTVAATAAVVSLSPGVAAADSPSYALSCSAAGIAISIPAAISEGVLSPNPVNSGSAVALVSNAADVTGGSLTGGTLLNPPDTGLGIEISFPVALEALTTAGDSVQFAGSIPLTVTGGTGTPSESVSGTFTVPATYPAGAVFVSVPATLSGSITAGASGTVSVGTPVFTAGTPLSLSLTITNPATSPPTVTPVPLTCTTTAAETIDTAAITPTPFIAVSPNSYAFTSAADTAPITVTGGNWQPSSPISLKWSAGGDTGNCTTNAAGNINAGCTITASSSEVGANQAPFSDSVVATGTNGAAQAATASAPVQLTPFVSLNTFCVATPTGLGQLQAPHTTSPSNPLTITQGFTTAPYKTPPPTPGVGCDPKQQIDVQVLGSYLYIWESQTGHNPDAAHVGLSPVQLGLDTNSSALGGNLPPCSPFSGTCVPAVNNGQFDQALGQLNTVTVQDDRGTLSGWTVTGQLESDFNNQTPIGPAVDNVIPADFLTWQPGVALATPGSLPNSNQNIPSCPDQTPPPTGYLACTGPSGTPAVGGAAVNGTGPTGTGGTGGVDSTPAEVFAGSPNTLNNLQGSADVLCATNASLDGGAAGGGGSFDCSAGLSLAVPPYVAAGDYRTVMDITVLGF
jgi:hypothetical protein